MQPYDETSFKERVQRALEVTRRVLDVNKNPKIPSEVFHQYEDKYTLAESITNVAVAAQLNCLESLGLTDKKLSVLQGWVQENSSVTVRLQAQEECSFLREVERKVDSDTYVKEVKVNDTCYHV